MGYDYILIHSTQFLKHFLSSRYMRIEIRIVSSLLLVCDDKR